MKKTVFLATMGLACAAHRSSLTPAELAAARDAGLIIIEKADCGAVMQPVADGCAVELGTHIRGTFTDSRFTIRCPELRDVCGTEYDCTCHARVRSTMRNGPRPRSVEPLADPFHATRLVGDTPAFNCFASLYVGSRDCFVSVVREFIQKTVEAPQRIRVDFSSTSTVSAPFEYWLTCGEETNLCGKPATCVCSSE